MGELSATLAHPRHISLSDRVALLLRGAHPILWGVFLAASALALWSLRPRPEVDFEPDRRADAVVLSSGTVEVGRDRDTGQPGDLYRRTTFQFTTNDGTTLQGTSYTRGASTLSAGQSVEVELLASDPARCSRIVGETGGMPGLESHRVVFSAFAVVTALLIFLALVGRAMQIVVLRRGVLGSFRVLEERRPNPSIDEKNYRLRIALSAPGVEKETTLSTREPSRYTRDARFIQRVSFPCIRIYLGPLAPVEVSAATLVVPDSARTLTIAFSLIVAWLGAISLAMVV